jgi:acetylornithine deacetylase
LNHRATFVQRHELETHPSISRLYCSHVQQLGCTPRISGFTAAAGLAWYAGKGIPGAILGPGDLAHAHSADEFVLVSDLLNATKAIAFALLGWCGMVK